MSELKQNSNTQGFDFLPINTYNKLKVGETGCGTVLDENMNEIHVAIQVLEEIDIETYLKDVGDRGLMNRVRPNIRTAGLFFYRIKILD